MNRTRPEARDCTPAEAIAHALDDHWLTTPPNEPIYHSQAAEHVLAHLDDHGYRIYPGSRPDPVSRANLAFNLLLAAICLTGTLVCAARHDWPWAAAGLLGTVVFSREYRSELRALRRQERRTP